MYDIMECEGTISVEIAFLMFVVVAPLSCSFVVRRCALGVATLGYETNS